MYEAVMLIDDYVAAETLCVKTAAGEKNKDTNSGVQIKVRMLF